MSDDGSGDEGFTDGRRPRATAPTIGRVRPRTESALPAGVVHRRSAAVADACLTSSVRAAGASVVGSAHRYAGTSRQDAFSLHCAEGGALVVGVADGLGSRPFSQVGAQAFCDRLAALAGAPASAADLLLEAAEDAGASVAALGVEADLAAFVALVAVIGSDTVDVARVGDCSAFALDHDGFHELFPAPEGALNTVAAAFPTAGSADVETVQAPIEHGSLVMVSDGVSTDVRTSPRVREWLRHTWREPVDEVAMLDSLGYLRQGSSDDRTAVVVWQEKAATSETSGTDVAALEETSTAATDDAGSIGRDEAPEPLPGNVWPGRVRL